MNIYRVLKAFYLISTYLLYKERYKLINIFILTLDLYSVKINNIVEAFYKLIK